MIFVCSMGDLFHEDVPFDFIREVFSVMSMSTQHVFQVLTKRSERLAEFAAGIQWPSNVWAGVTVENDKVKYRIDDLKKVSAPVRFLSIEPLISSLGKLELSGIDWVIVGGECGTSDRPMEKEWVDSIKDQCLQTKTPFFFKQWGGFNKKKNGRLLDSRTYDEMPFYYDQTK
jgi:protein gp37